jgi:hypothetical protein
MHGFGVRLTRQSPYVPDTFQHKQKRRFSSLNPPINRTANQPENARDFSRLQTRWSTGHERLNRAALHHSGEVDEADRRLADRGTVPTPIDHGSRRWIDPTKLAQFR